MRLARMTRMKVRAAHLALWTLLLSGCLRVPDCLPTASPFIRIEVRNLAGASQPITWVSITEPDTGNVLYEGEEASALVLPVRADRSEITYVFRWESQERFMTFTFTDRVEYVSPDCGAFLYFENLRVPETTFANWRLVNPLLRTNVPVNVEISL